MAIGGSSDICSYNDYQQRLRMRLSKRHLLWYLTAFFNDDNHNTGCSARSLFYSVHHIDGVSLFSAFPGRKHPTGMELVKYCLEMLACRTNVLAFSTSPYVVVCVCVCVCVFIGRILAKIKNVQYYIYRFWYLLSIGAIAKVVARVLDLLCKVEYF